MRGRRGGRKRRILEAIPHDKFVRAGVIASKAGVSPEGVGVLISWNFIPAYVERKEIDDPKPGTYVYRRLPCTPKSKRKRD